MRFHRRTRTRRDTRVPLDLFLVHLLGRNSGEEIINPNRPLFSLRLLTNEGLMSQKALERQPQPAGSLGDGEEVIVRTSPVENICFTGVGPRIVLSFDLPNRH